MRHLKQFFCLLLGMLTAFAMGQFIIPAGAAGWAGVAVYLDDAPDAFLCGGVAYLPLDAIGKAIGQPVQWDAKTDSIYLGSHIKKKPAAWLEDLEPSESSGKMDRAGTVKDNLGDGHGHCVAPYAKSSFLYTYKLNERYTKITGVLLKNYLFRSSKDAGTLKIYGDGRFLFKATVYSGIEPIPFSIDLTGVSELTVDFKTKGVPAENVLGDCALWT